MPNSKSDMIRDAYKHVPRFSDNADIISKVRELFSEEVSTQLVNSVLGPMETRAVTDVRLPQAKALSKFCDKTFSGDMELLVRTGNMISGDERLG